MPDLKTQLGDYLDHVIERVGEEEIVEGGSGAGPVRPLQPRVPLRGAPRRLAYAIAAALVTLLLVGGLAWLVDTSDGDETPVISEPPPVPTTPLELNGMGDPATWLWTELEAPPGWIQSDGRHFYTIERMESPEGSVVVWSSPDGAAWHQVAELTPDSFVELLDVAEGRALVASRSEPIFAAVIQPDGTVGIGELHLEVPEAIADPLLSVEIADPDDAAIGPRGALIWTVPLVNTVIDERALRQLRDSGCRPTAGIGGRYPLPLSSRSRTKAWPTSRSSGSTTDF